MGNILGLAILAATELSEPIQLLHETMAIISEQQKFREHFEAERNVWMAQKNPQTKQKPQINQLAKRALYDRREESTETPETEV